MEKLHYGDLPKQFIEVIPEFKCLYSYVESSYGEVINHLFFDTSMVIMIIEIHKYSIMSPEDNRKYAENILGRIFNFIEMCSTSGDEDIETLIVTGFLESLYGDYKYYDQIKQRLGIKTLALLEHLEQTTTQISGRIFTLMPNKLDDKDTKNLYSDEIACVKQFFTV